MPLHDPKKTGNPPDYRGQSVFSSNNDSASSSPGDIQMPVVALPKGGGAIKGIDEKFNVNAVTGTAAFSIPIPYSPGRNGYLPGFELSYHSGSGNSSFGLGWEVTIPCISRKTEDGLPRYRDAEESDTFVLSGAEDLVPLLEWNGSEWKNIPVPRTVDGVQYMVMRYRPRIEGTFTRIEKWTDTNTSQVHWRIISADNHTSYYGLTTDSQLVDPDNGSRVFKWMLCRTHDDKGNLVQLVYKQEDFAGIPAQQNEIHRLHHCTQLYIKKILYGNQQAWYLGDTMPEEKNFLFKVIFDYGEHDTAANIPKDIDQEKNSWTCRKDPFSSYRSGFEIRTYRRCCRVMMFHCFPEEQLPVNPCLVKSLQLLYDDHLSLTGNGSQVNGYSFLVKARQNGHLWDAGANAYRTKYFPELELQYQSHEWNTSVQAVSPDNLVHAPVGIDDKTYLWVDLYSEGIAGILTEQGGGWYYKSNLGNGQFSPAKPVAPRPSYGGLNKGVMIQELEGNGIKYLVQVDKKFNGFFKLTEDATWEGMKYFEQTPVLYPKEKNMRFIDLTGDHMPDMLYTDEYQFRWYAGAGEKGFEVPETVIKATDEEQGPAIVFTDQEQCIFLADMSGDGLTDIVRIRNGEICYWPNLGYGRFGAKVNMDHAPVFDYPAQFNPAYLRLADIDGSGTTDVIYLGKNNFSVWMNLNGNEWAATPEVVTTFPAVNQMAHIAVMDFLGTGTATIVYASPIAGKPLQYIDLMGSKKPALLIGYKNNCGREVTIEYKSSTFYYLEDKLRGIPWITKLPFPVHCISRVTTADKVRETIFTNTYRYRHGYYDATEKEFRGFARVEQDDTEVFSQFVVNTALNVVEEDLHQPPVTTISWFHTGAYLANQQLLHQCATEYFNGITPYDMPDPILPAGLEPYEIHEALRACKGQHLRTEVYAFDGSLQQSYPYTAMQANNTIRLIQPKGSNRYASFQLLPSESITYAYERNPADPRIAHSFVLETDDLGYTTKAAAVIYPRLSRPAAPNDIPDKVWDEQRQLHITYNETGYTKDVIADDTYRLREQCESRAYEVGGIGQPPGFYLHKTNLAGIPAATVIQYEEEFSGGVQKRLSAHGRIYYLKDDLSGPLALGTLSSLGFVHRKYQLTFTQNLVTKYYGTEVTSTMLADAGYTHTEADVHWWAPSGTDIFSATPAADFYIPTGTKDVFGREHHIQYDALHILVESSTDAIGNTVTADNDYRVLKPHQITDINGNRSAVETDELGFVVKIAVMGKAGSSDGDTLADPTNRMEYDLFNWVNNGKPNYVHCFSREQHGAANPRWQESYAYSNGSGGVIMTKNQVNPGKAKVWNNVTHTVDEVDANPRWIGNGRTIYNNKGNAVKKYEPYFSTTSDYESEAELVETGVTATRYYDPTGRLIKTVFPNGTFSNIEFTPWYFKSFDVNDNVVASQWYSDRGSPLPGDPEPSDPETRAAWLTTRHNLTPAMFHSDAIGRPLMTISDYGAGKTTAVWVETDALGRYSKSFDQLKRLISFGAGNMAGGPMYSKTAEKGEKWVFQDVQGRIYKMWNGGGQYYRFEFDDLDRPVSSYLKVGATEWLYARVVYGDLFPDAQARALNMKGKIYQVYDQSGVSTIKGIDFKGNITAAEKRLTKHYQQLIDWTPLKGLIVIPDILTAAEPLLETATYSSAGTFDALNRPISATLPDQSIVQPIYNEANFIATLNVKPGGVGAFIPFLKSQDYDARGQRQIAQYGNGTITKYFYDPLTFRLTDLLTLQKDTDTTPEALQNISFTYDPIGNITQIRDDAQQTHFFKNTVVYPESKFEYNAIYQLTKASGREHAGLSMDTQRNNTDIAFISQLPEMNDSTAVRIYTEQYDFDDCSNIRSLKHNASGATWQQRYHYEYEDDPSNVTNRLKATSMPGDAPGVFSGTYVHNAGGNMTSMPHLSAPNSLIWNFQSQLSGVNLGGGGQAYYVYGSGGQRCRKIIERIGGKRLERIYLGAVEIYRESIGMGAPDFERYTLRIADNTGVIAQVDTKTIDTLGSDPGTALNVPVVRYQYGNHIGSAMMETNSTGEVISYEEYHPFGTSAYRIAKPGANLSMKRYRFCGKERDEETGFYYFGARYYAAWLGRWISSDPAGFVDGLNLYCYCSNNPVMIQDPTGTDGGRVTISGHATGRETEADIRNVLRKQGYDFHRMPTWEPNASGTGGRWNFGDDNLYRIPRGSGSSHHSSGATHPSGGGAGSGSGAGTTPPPTGAGAGSGGDAGAPPPDTHPQSGPTGTPGGAAGGTPGGSPGGGPGGSPGGSPGGVPGGSPQGSAGGSPQGTPGGSPNGTPGGSGSGGGGGERSFWSRGGATLLGGLLLLGAGLLTIFTAGAATPLLVLAAGAMATAGGVAVTTASAVQLGVSYSGGTTAAQDREMQHALSTVSSLSSPGGLVGGTVGAAVDGDRGLQRGALIGNVAELGYGVTNFGISRFSGGAARELSSDTGLISNMATMEPTVPRGVFVIGSHGEPGLFQTTAGTMAPIGELAPMIQSAPQGRITLLMCNVAHDPAAVQALSNETGRSITAYTNFVGSVNYNSVVSFAGTHTTGLVQPSVITGVASPSVFNPTYLSPYLSLTPNVAAPAAATVGGVQAQQ
ncbi:RHS repeat-associated protein [Chitinophaga polysaccharea]|uniref:RHS repeat-associated protein n=1 Tax=Chitinophaga polysaccharea TaxID=1293035 RepID=A0A561PUI2_9BACT|nr:SpvB/TcaC N-terminal domain-containing protein [Chitinophaga polysaccharea]TWF41773.1 RHS repeat-associated protein [Chitinophaga polysaccharea]